MSAVVWGPDEYGGYSADAGALYLSVYLAGAVQWQVGARDVDWFVFGEALTCNEGIAIAEEVASAVLGALKAYGVTK